jgi:hypothetical protein
MRCIYLFIYLFLRIDEAWIFLKHIVEHRIFTPTGPTVVEDVQVVNKTTAMVATIASAKSSDISTILEYNFCYFLFIVTYLCAVKLFQKPVELQVKICFEFELKNLGVVLLLFFFLLLIIA